MKISIKLLKSARKTTVGFPVVVELFHDYKLKRFSLGVYSEIDHWNDQKKQPFTSHPEFDVVMTKIIDAKMKILEIQRSGESDVDRAIRALKNENENKNRQFENFFVFFPESTLDFHPGEFQLEYEDVFFHTQDGRKLHGWYFPLDRKSPVILFLHGNAGNISHRLDNIGHLLKRGLQVFIFDYRGYGKSRFSS